MSSSRSETSTNDPMVPPVAPAINTKPEPSSRARIFDLVNKSCAETKSMLALPQPGPSAHGLGFLYGEFAWTDEDSQHYLADGTRPRDLTTIEKDAEGLLMWIFAARGCGDTLPEYELDVKPDFERYRALVVFDFGGTRMALVPSQFLDMVEKGEKKVQFNVKHVRQFVMNGWSFAGGWVELEI